MNLIYLFWIFYFHWISFLNNFNMNFTCNELNNHLNIKIGSWCKHDFYTLTWYEYWPSFILEDRLKSDKMGCLTPSHFITKHPNLELTVRITKFLTKKLFFLLLDCNQETHLHVILSFYKFIGNCTNSNMYKEELFLVWNFLFCPYN